MVSLKMKLKKPTFKIGGKKNKKEEQGEIIVEPTVAITPENDPIMEDREDTADVPFPVEEERHPMNDEEKLDEEESVMTEEPDAEDDDALSTVAEEPSKEEAEEKAAEQSAPPAKEQESSSLLEDESLTLDDTATTLHEAGSPTFKPAFCGCFSV